MNYFNCAIYYIKKYECTPEIKDSKGLVILDLSEFELNEYIYITYLAVNGGYDCNIHYNFSDFYPKKVSEIKLENILGWYSYYEETIVNTKKYRNYYKLTKTNKYKYLILDYKIYNDVDYIEVDNTRFSFGVKVGIIIGCSIGGIWFIAFLIGIYCIFINRHKIRCCRKSNPNDYQNYPTQTEINQNCPVNNINDDVYNINQDYEEPNESNESNENYNNNNYVPPPSHIYDQVTF